MQILYFECFPVTFWSLIIRVWSKKGRGKREQERNNEQVLPLCRGQGKARLPWVPVNKFCILYAALLTS